MAKGAALEDQASRLYIEEDMTLAEIAELMPEVTLRTLETWSAKYGWRKQRLRYKKLNRDVNAYLTKIKMRLAAALMEDEPEPQHIYALAKGLAALKPGAAVELRQIEKAEDEARAMSPEERMARIREVIEAEYGIKRDR